MQEFDKINKKKLMEQMAHAARMRDHVAQGKKGRMLFVLSYLSKKRARNMWRAYCAGVYEEGNHRIECVEDHMQFYYRGTKLAVYNMRTMDLVQVSAGDFDQTCSTIRQRESIERAVVEFRNVIATIDREGNL